MHRNYEILNNCVVHALPPNNAIIGLIIKPTIYQGNDMIKHVALLANSGKMYDEDS